MELYEKLFDDFYNSDEYVAMGDLPSTTSATNALYEELDSIFRARI